MYIFIDESGDLGFDFKKSTTNHFVVTAITLEDNQIKGFNTAVKKTIQNTIAPERSNTSFPHELKGSRTSLNIKKYFWEQVKAIPFFIFTLALHKERLTVDSEKSQNHLYDFLSRIILDSIPIPKDQDIHVHIDRSKGKYGRAKFNEYISDNIKQRITPKQKLTIKHMRSQRSPGIQGADMFAWGILHKYRDHDEDWYQVFKEKVAFESHYLGSRPYEVKE